MDWLTTGQRTVSELFAETTQNPTRLLYMDLKRKGEYCQLGGIDNTEQISML